jgi:hypothetical protein
MLLRLVSAAPDGDGWAHERELEGWRAFVQVGGDRVTICSRNGKDWGERGGLMLADESQACWLAELPRTRCIPLWLARTHPGAVGLLRLVTDCIAGCRERLPGRAAR